ncbi:MAG: TonB-dependent receptor [bacterium]|nr:TonB-dependent receptor [bacterium]
MSSSNNYLHRTSLVALLFIVLSLITAATAQTSDAVDVVIKDANGSPIVGATVEASLSGISVQRIVTDTTGTARFSGLRSGNYRFSAAAEGFSNLSSEVVLPSQTPVPIEIMLGARGISEVVTVTAARTEVTSDETPVPVSVVGREMIEEKNLNSVGEIFRSLPGTSTVNEGAFQVRPRIRGLDSNRVLILVDGERLNNSRTSTGQSGVEIGLVDNSQIESVEVVRGSGSVLYGTDALAGTINIITRDTPVRRDSGFRFGATLDTLYSSNENGRRGSVGVTGSGKWFAFRLAHSMDRFENYFAGDANATDLERLRAEDLQITDDGEVLNSQSHGSSSQVTVRFFPTDSSSLKLGYDQRRAADIGSAGLAGPNTGVPGLTGVFNAYFPFSNRDRFSARYDIAGITSNLQRVSARAFYQTQYRDFTNSVTVGPIPPFFPGVYQYSETVTDTKTAGYDVQTDWVFGQHRVVAGTSFFTDQNTDRRLSISGSRPTSANLVYRNTRSVPDADLSNVAFFGQDEYKVNSRLKLIGGIRWDRFRTSSEPTQDFVLDPRLTSAQIEQLGIVGLADGLDVTNSAFTGDIGAVYTVTDKLILSARVGRSFRTPNISERFFTDAGSAEGFLVGNPQLVPETGINFDATVRYRTKRLVASATYFNNYFENFLATQFTGIRLPSGRGFLDVYQTQNIRTARIQGFEAEVDAPFRISAGFLTPYGNFSYLRGDDLDRDLPLDFISPIRVNAGVRWQNVGKNYFFDYNTRIVTKQERLSPTFLALNDGPEPGYVTHNMSGGYYFRREKFNFSVTAGISNLFDRYFSEQFTYAPARGRSFTIGTTWAIK